jgi:hypothetical protein
MMSIGFKSFEKSQTYYQKEERFTVQNKMTNAGPDQRKYSKSTTLSFNTNPCMPVRTVHFTKQENEANGENHKLTGASRHEMEPSRMGSECTVLKST